LEDSRRERKAFRDRESYEVCEPKSIRNFAGVMVADAMRRSRFGNYSGANEFPLPTWKHVAFARMIEALSGELRCSGQL
jgi:hypothetical protein